MKRWRAKTQDGVRQGRAGQGKVKTRALLRTCCGPPTETRFNTFAEEHVCASARRNSPPCENPTAWKPCCSFSSPDIMLHAISSCLATGMKKPFAWSSATFSPIIKDLRMHTASRSDMATSKGHFCWQSSHIVRGDGLGGGGGIGKEIITGHTLLAPAVE